MIELQRHKWWQPEKSSVWIKATFVCFHSCCWYIESAICLLFLSEWVSEVVRIIGTHQMVVFFFFFNKNKKSFLQWVWKTLSSVLMMSYDVWSLRKRMLLVPMTLTLVSVCVCVFFPVGAVDKYLSATLFLTSRWLRKIQ